MAVDANDDAPTLPEMAFPPRSYVCGIDGGVEHQTEDVAMSSGQKNTFWIPLEKLAPVTGKITIRVYDRDALSSNDMISILAFDDPCGPQSDNRPWDDAEYHSTVEFDR